MYVYIYIFIYLYLSEFTKTDPKNIKKWISYSPHPTLPHPTPTHPTPPHPYLPPAKMMKYMIRDAMKYGSDIYIYGQSIKQIQPHNNSRCPLLC